MKKKSFFRLFSAGLIVVLMISISVPAFAATYPDQDDNGKMWYQTNLDFGDEYTYAYDIQGYVEGNLFSTTYENDGYSVFLQDGDDQAIDTGTGANGNERIFGDLGLTTRLTFVNDGNYVKVEYVVRNTTALEKTFSLATTSDTQIGDADIAPIEILNDSSIVMRDGDSAQFNIICRDAIGVTDVDSIWIGYYDEQYANMFNDGPEYYDEDDSGMAFSWKDRTLSANGSKTFSVLYSVGAVNSAPTLSLLPAASEVAIGQTMTIQGSVSDLENSSGTKVYYVLDGGAPTPLFTFASAPGSFSGSIVLPSSQDFIGEHIILFYAEDALGALSPTASASLKAIAAPVNETPPVAEQTQTPDTGDTNMLPVFFLMLLGGMGTIGGFFARNASRTITK
jgi:hypothetical protein